MNTTRQHLSPLRRWWRHALAVIGSLALLLALLFALTPKPNGIRLDSLGHKNAAAYSINNRGEMLGSFDDAEGQTHGIYWDAQGNARSFEEIFQLPNVRISDLLFSAINDHGQFVGGIKDSTQQPPRKAFLWDPVRGLQFLPLPDEGGHATGINNQGQIIGQIDAGGSTQRVFFYNESHGVLEPNYFANVPQTPGTADHSPAPKTIPSNSTIYAINDLGHVVGEVQTNDEEKHAFLWKIPFSHATGEAPLLRDLGTLGGKTSAALGLNNLGQIVGSSETATGQTHAFLWDDENGMQDIHHLLQGNISIAADINDHGQIVGCTESTSGNKTRAFCWSPHSGLIWLDDFGAETSIAIRINNHGQIAGLIQFPPPWPIRSWNWLAGKIPALHDYQIYDSKHTRTEPVLWTIPPPVTKHTAPHRKI